MNIVRITDPTEMKPTYVNLDYLISVDVMGDNSIILTFDTQGNFSLPAQLRLSSQKNVLYCLAVLEQFNSYKAPAQNAQPTTAPTTSPTSSNVSGVANVG